VVVAGEPRPRLDGVLGRLVASVGEVKRPARGVVRQRAVRFPGAEGVPGLLLGGVLGAVDGLQLSGWGVACEPVEHPAGADRGELLAVADRDQLPPERSTSWVSASRRT